MNSERDQPAIDALRSARDESRVALDHQLSLLDDIDDKAIRIVRLSIVLLALVISIGQFVGPERIATFHVVTLGSVGIAVVLLSFSVFVGVAIYSVSHVSFGVGPAHRSEVRDGAYSEREWLNLLLDEYDEWERDVVELNENNAVWIGRTQHALGLAVTYLFVASVAVSTPISALYVFVVVTSIAGVGFIAWYALGRQENDDRY